MKNKKTEKGTLHLFKQKKPRQAVLRRSLLHAGAANIRLVSVYKVVCFTFGSMHSLTLHGRNRLKYAKPLCQHTKKDCGTEPYHETACHVRH
eukprot:6464295-Amphidinium_carterae.1